MPAQYFCSGEIPKDQWHHYGLGKRPSPPPPSSPPSLWTAAPVYTHFTSPIRRYADLVVHRLLSAAIGDTSLPPSNADRAKQQELCSHMNRSLSLQPDLPSLISSQETPISSTCSASLDWSAHHPLLQVPCPSPALRSSPSSLQRPSLCGDCLHPLCVRRQDHRHRSQVSPASSPSPPSVHISLLLSGSV
jgi:hypothetical protein